MKESLLVRLDTMCERYEELAALMSDPTVIGDQNKFREYSKEYSDLEELVKAYDAYKEVKEDVEEAKTLMSDGDLDMREMAEEAWKEAKENLELLDRTILEELL